MFDHEFRSIPKIPTIIIPFVYFTFIIIICKETSEEICPIFL